MPLRAAVARRRDAVRDEGERLGRLLHDCAKTMQHDFAAVRAQQEWLSRVEALGIAGLVEAATAAPPPVPPPKGRRRSTSRARARALRRARAGDAAAPPPAAPVQPSRVVAVAGDEEPARLR